MSKALTALDALHRGGVAEIKVGRKHVHKIPFERFYVVPEDLRDDMMRYWRYALCLSASCRNAQVMLTALSGIKEEFAAICAYMQKNGPWMIMVPIAVRNRPNSTWDTSFWMKEQRKSQDRVDDEPTEYRPRVQKNRGVLQYLVSRFWSNSSDRKISNDKDAPRYADLTEDVFLLGQLEGPIGSPCSICPRQLQRLMKQCVFGDIDCYEFLCTKPDTDGDYKKGADEFEADAAARQKEAGTEDLEDLGEIVIETGGGERKIVNVEDI